jgi:hypothetical protein
LSQGFASLSLASQYSHHLPMSLFLVRIGLNLPPGESLSPVE